MAINTINVGSTPNDGTGDSIRVAFQKANDNFSFLQTSIINLVANSVVVNDVTRLEGGGLFTGTFRIRATELDQYFDIATTNQTFAGGTVAGATQFTSTQEATAIGSGGAVQVTGGFGVAGRSYFNQVFASNITVSAGLNITTANTINASLANVSVANLDTGLVFATDGIITFGNVNAANLVLGENGQITFGDGTTLASALQTLTSNAAAQSEDLTSLLANSATQAIQITSLQANIAAANAAISTLGALDVEGLTANIVSLQSNIAAANTTISTIDANLGTLNTTVDSIQANLGAYQEFGNLSFSTLDANIGTITVNFGNLDANIGAFQTYSNANAATRTIEFNTLEANVGTIRLELNTAEDDILGANAAIDNLRANITAANAELANKTFASLSDVNVAGITGGQTVTWNAVDSKFEPANLGELSVGNADTLDGFDSAYFATSANVGAYQTYANAWLSQLDANVGAHELYANTIIGTIDANLGVISTITVPALDANIGAFQTYANANLSTVSGQISSLQTHETFANGAIAAIDANLGAYQLWANTTISTLDANLGAASNNIGSLFTADDNLNANIGAFQTYANLTIGTLDANIGAFQTYANSNLSGLYTSTTTLDANVGAYQGWANLSLAPLFQPSFTGGRVETDGNLVIFGGNAVVYAASTPTSEIGDTGDTAGRIHATASAIYVCFADHDGVSTIWTRVTGDATPWT